MIDFKKLKASSGSASFTKLTQEMEKINSKQFSKDDRYWYPEVDKAGNGYAVIRFLPACADEDSVPFVRLFSHAFQGPSGSWYFENSLTTIGKTDPVSEYNSKLWNSGIESDKALARKYKRNVAYICNVLVITDKQNPENEGKVFLFKMGKKIYEKLNLAMHPEFPDEQAMNPFDLWEGAPLYLKIRNVEGYRNYDTSTFGKIGPLGTDAEIEAVANKCHALAPIVAPDQFKSYEELKERFNKVIGGRPADTASASVAALVDEETPARVLPSTKAPAIEEDDDLTSFFDKLNEED